MALQSPAWWRFVEEMPKNQGAVQSGGECLLLMFHLHLDRSSFDFLKEDIVNQLRESPLKGNMIKMVSAFLAGVLVTYVVMNYVMTRAGETGASGIIAESDEALSADALGGASGNTAANSAADSEPLGGSTARRQDGAAPSRGMADWGARTRSVLVATGDGSASLATGAASVSPSATETASEGEDGAVADSNRNEIPVPQELAGLLDEGGRMAQLHRQVENEAEELSWSTYMEAQIAGYLNQKLALSELSIPLIECRTTLCEVQVIGYGDSPMQSWMNATGDMRAQPW